MYFAPFVVLFLVLKTLSTFPWYMGLPLSLLEFMGMHVGIIKYLLPAPSHDALWKTPYFSCIFQASAFWVLFTWLFKIVYGMDGSMTQGIKCTNMESSNIPHVTCQCHFHFKLCHCHDCLLSCCIC